MNSTPRTIEVEVLPPETARSTTGPRSNDLQGWVAWVMDELFTIPGTNFRVGIDPLIGLIPGIGDGSSAAVSALVILRAAATGVPRIVLASMAGNVLVNTLGGSLPVLGDLFSLWFKSNVRNRDLLERHAGRRGVSTRADWIFVGLLLVAIGLVVCAVAAVGILITVSLARWIF